MSEPAPKPAPVVRPKTIVRTCPACSANVWACASFCPACRGSLK